MANFDGIIPELAKAGFIKKVNDLRSQISTLQQEIDTISESTKTMFWSNSIPSDLGTVGELQSFSTQVKAYSLIDVPPTYSVIAGSLPSGLTLNPVNGYITGVVGNYETITPCVFTVQAADNQTTITKQFTITVNAVNDVPTWITANELGDMTVDFISIQLSVNDPDSTPTFTIVDGSLPSSVTLSSSGLISGANPRDNLTYTFTVEANDGVNQVQRQFTFVAFNEAPVWATDGDLGTITGSSFSKSLSATDNDSAVLTYSVNPLSELPVGVNLSNNGVLSGLNPLTNTSHTFDIDVSDGVNVITRTFFFYAYSEAPVWVSNASLGSFDTPTISIQLRATDAENEPLTYAVVAGSLPTGLTLTSSGLISGNNPFDGLTSSFTISVSDKANSVNREFSITCEVAAGEAIYTSVGNYSFTVPMGVREIDALVVAGSTGFTSVGNVKATKGSVTEDTISSFASLGSVALTASCYGSSGFVLGSSDGNIYRLESTDNGFKKSVNVLGTSSISKIIFVNGVYYAFAGSKLASSTDGLNWGLQSTDVGITVLDAIHVNGMTILVGRSVVIRYSTDNLNSWNTTNSQFGSSNINSIVFGNGVFVIAGDSGKIASSVDGITWTLRVSGTTAILGESSAYGNGLFVISKKSTSSITSSDGVIWTENTNIPYMKALVYSPSFGFVGLVDKTVKKSVDGVTWSSKTVSSSTYSVYTNSISYNNNNEIVFAVGQTSKPYAFFSKDGGNTAYEMTREISGFLNSDVYLTDSDNNLVIASDGSQSSIAVCSSDGFCNVLPYTKVNTIAANEDLSLIVIGANTGGTSHQVSTDAGFSWTPISSAPYNMVNWSSKTVQFYFFRGTFVALVIGDSLYTFYTSTDLVNWSGYGISNASSAVARIVNDIMFIETNKGNFYSYDGVVWNSTPSGFSPTGYYDGKYYQYDSSTTIKYSSDISSNFTSVNVVSLIGGQSGLSSVGVTKHGHFILTTSNPAANIKGTYMSTDGLVSSQRVDGLNTTLSMTYDGVFGLFRAKLDQGGRFIPKFNLKIENPSSIYILGNYKALASRYVTVYEGAGDKYTISLPNGDVSSLYINQYNELIFFNNMCAVIHNLSTKNNYYVSFDSGIPSPRHCTFFNNKYMFSFDKYVASIDRDTKVFSTYLRNGLTYGYFNEHNGSLYAVATAAGTAQGNLIVKTDDGYSWQDVTTMSYIGTLMKADDKLWHIGTSYISSSVDGANWSTSPTSLGMSNDLKYVNNLWVSVSGISSDFKYSSDLITWTTVDVKTALSPFLFLEVKESQDYISFYAYGKSSTKSVLTFIQKGTSNTDATLTRPSTEGFSLTNPNNNGNYGKLSGIAGYKNNIPVNPSDTINVSVPSLDGAVRIIWGGSRDFPNNAV